jgi:hypothetical protein
VLSRNEETLGRVIGSFLSQAHQMMPARARAIHLNHQLVAAFNSPGAISDSLSY